MSLQPGINPLDRRTDSFSPRPGRGMGHLDLTEEQKAKMIAPLLKRPDLDGPGPGMKTMEVRDQHYSFPSAEEMERRMGPGMTNMGGFDASDLMKRPGMAQQSTRDQAEKVSEPYREANMMAADKTNPMNAASQEPGKTFLQDYILKGPNFSTFTDPGQPLLIPKRK